MSTPETTPPPKKKPRRSVAENLVFRTPFICIICFLILANFAQYGIGGPLALLVCAALVLAVPISAIAGLVACSYVGWGPSTKVGLKIATFFSIIVNVLSILIWTVNIHFFCYYFFFFF